MLLHLDGLSLDYSISYLVHVSLSDDHGCLFKLNPNWLTDGLGHVNVLYRPLLKKAWFYAYIQSSNRIRMGVTTYTYCIYSAIFIGINNYL